MSWYDGREGIDHVDYYYSPEGVNVDLAYREVIVNDPATPEDETATAPAWNRYTGFGQGGWAEGDRYVNIENISGSDFADTIKGDAGSNKLLGGFGDDRIYGRQGNDNVGGRTGNDYVHGGAGDDKVEGNKGNDKLVGGSGQDTLIGGPGRDWAIYGGSKTGVDVSLERGTGVFVDPGVVLGEDGSPLSTEDKMKMNHAAGDTLQTIEFLRGSRHNDTLTGDGEDNRLYGNAGADVLSGGDGRDRMEGEAGADTLNGGDGRDWAMYRTSDGAVTVSLVAGATNTGGDAEGDVLSNIEHLRGSVHADILTGNAGNNRIHGNGGADTLTGGDGKDVFIFVQELNFLDPFGGATITDFTVGEFEERRVKNLIERIEDGEYNEEEEEEVTENVKVGGDRIRIKSEAGDIVFGDNLVVTDSQDGEDAIITWRIDLGEDHEDGDSPISTLTLEGVDHITITEEDFIF